MDDKRWMKNACSKIIAFNILDGKFNIIHITNEKLDELATEIYENLMDEETFVGWKKEEAMKEKKKREKN